MKLPSVFTVGDNQARGVRELIPNGEYVVEVFKSAIADNKAKNGKRLNLTFKILEGEYQGKTLKIGYNIVHPNQQCVDISNGEIEELCIACGFEKGVEVEDTEEFHNIAILGTIVTEEGSGDFGDSNGFSKFEPMSSENPF